MTSSLMKLFARLFPLRHPTDEEVLTNLRSIVGPCPICGDKTVGHSLGTLASVILTGETPQQIETLISENAWTDASAIRQWAHDADVREYRILRCPGHDDVALLAMVFRHDLYGKDFVEKTQRLSPDEAVKAIAAVGEDWTTL